MFGGIVASGLKVTGSGSGKIMLAPAPYPACKGDLEIRRDAPGLKEFLGTVIGKNGNVYSVDYGGLNKKKGYVPPQNGETVYMWCTGGGGSKSIASTAIGGLSDIPMWVWLVAAGIIVFVVLQNKKESDK